MALPDLFQRLVDEDGWVISANVEYMMERNYIIESDGLKFSLSEAKDTGPHFSVGSAKDNRRAMHPCALVRRMGEIAGDEFEAFGLIAKDTTSAKRQLASYRFRKRFLEPALVLPLAPLLALSVVPFVRGRVLEFLGWWVEGPVKRLVD